MPLCARLERHRVCILHVFFTSTPAAPPSVVVPSTAMRTLSTIGAPELSHTARTTTHTHSVLDALTFLCSDSTTDRQPLLGVNARTHRKRSAGRPATTLAAQAGHYHSPLNPVELARAFSRAPVDNVGPPLAPPKGTR